MWEFVRSTCVEKLITGLQTSRNTRRPYVDYIRQYKQLTRMMEERKPKDAAEPNTLDLWQHASKGK